MSSQEASTIERSIRTLQGQSGFALTADYGSIGRYTFTICGGWNLLGVTATEDELSFVAQKEKQPPMRFFVYRRRHESMPDHLTGARAWFSAIAQELTTFDEKKKPAKPWRIPEGIIFKAEVTEFIKRIPQAQAA